MNRPARSTWPPARWCSKRLTRDQPRSRHNAHRHHAQRGHRRHGGPRREHARRPHPRRGRERGAHARSKVSPLVMHPFHKKLFRTMFHAWGQSLAVVSSCCAASRATSAVYSCYANLSLTRDTYYAQPALRGFRGAGRARARKRRLQASPRCPASAAPRGASSRTSTSTSRACDETRTGPLVSMPNPQPQVLDDIVLTAGSLLRSGTRRTKSS
jgi:hypothetical protein